MSDLLCRGKMKPFYYLDKVNYFSNRINIYGTLKKDKSFFFCLLSFFFNLDLLRRARDSNPQGIAPGGFQDRVKRGKFNKNNISSF